MQQRTLRSFIGAHDGMLRCGSDLVLLETLFSCAGLPSSSRGQEKEEPPSLLQAVTCTDACCCQIGIKSAPWKGAFAPCSAHLVVRVLTTPRQTAQANIPA